MRYKKAMLAGIILLAILTIGAVSASDDNATSDALAVEDIAGDTVDSPADNDVILDDDKEDYEYDVFNFPDEILPFKEYDVTELRLPYSNDGNLSVLIDDVEKYNENTTCVNEYYYIDLVPLFEGLSYNASHNVVLNYFGDSHYKDYTYSSSVYYDFMKFYTPRTFEVGENTFNMEGVEDLNGFMTLQIDGKQYATENVYGGESYIGYYADGYGTHEYVLEFNSSDERYVSRSISGSFEVTFYFEANLDGDIDDIHLGDKVIYDVDLPSDADGYVEVTCNGKTKKVKVNEGWAEVVIDDYKLGENNITFKYTHNSKTRTLNDSFIVHPVIDIKEHVTFNTDDGLHMVLPGDAKGELIVWIDGERVKNAQLKDGVLDLILSGYEFNVVHELEYNYTGSDYEIEGCGEITYFKVFPKLHYPSDAGIDENIEVTAELPSDANGNFTIECDDFSDRVSIVGGVGKIVIPKGHLIVSGIDYNTFYAEFNTNYGDSYEEIHIMPHEHSRDTQINISVDDHVVKGDYSRVTVDMPEDIGGVLSVYLGDNLLYNASIDAYEEVYVQSFISDLDFGTYDFTFKYTPHRYFKQSTLNKSININYYKVRCPQEMVIDESTTISVDFCNDAKGKVELYVNDELYKVEEITEYDGEYYSRFASFDLSDLPCGEYKAKVVYKGDGKYPGFSKDVSFNITYDVSIQTESEVYTGNPFEFDVVFAFETSGRAEVIVDGINYTAEIKNRTASFTIPAFFGHKNITVSYAGDDSHPAKSFVKELSTYASIVAPSLNYVADNINVSLALPKDANGELYAAVAMYDDGEGEYIVIENKTVPLVDGKAEISLKKLKLGEYTIISRYSGDDYQVDEYDYTMVVAPKITYNHTLSVGEDFHFLFEMPTDADGELVVMINGEEIHRKLVDGKANFTLSGLAAGEHLFTMSYQDSKYGVLNSDERDNYFEVYPLDLNIEYVIPKEMIANNPFTLTFKSPADLTGQIEVSIDEDYYCGEFENGVATVKVTSTKDGTFYVHYFFGGDSKYDYDSGSFNITILKPVKLTASNMAVFYKDGCSFKVKAYDSFGKLVGRGQSVTFYINGKKVKAVKTDKNGVATLKVSKVPGTYKIKATYKGASVTKKLTVKHLVTLKSVKVKKSAKKLVLTATLKKGKKALKGKKITFKFNGKKYTAKTNKRGVAKVTVKKSTLKKLKVGKKVTYQATYLKDVVKKSTKVKK